MDKILSLAELYSIALDNIDTYHYVFGDKKDRLYREFETILKDSKLADDMLYLYDKKIKTTNESQSLILYLIGLTDEAPLGEFTGLVNITTDRIAPIDIDIDVSAVRRQEVIDFISTQINAYPIMAFSTINKKSGIKDLGKALGFPYSLTDSITKSLEEGVESDLIKTVVNKYPNFFNEVDKLDGVIRHCSIHASGIAIFNGEPWDNYITLKKAPRKQEVAVDMDGSGLEKFGIMKIDILGSSTTDVIQNTSIMANLEIPPVEVLIEDKDVLEAFEECNVAGIFQAGGDTNKKVFDLVKPKTFLEVADCISLARPGTKKQLEAYCRYEPILQNEEVLKHLQTTRGVLLYQEQVLAIAMDIGGLTGQEAEILRRGIGKKEDAAYIEPVKQKFLDNAQKRIGEEAELLWDLIAEHVGYSFNKSHAVAYAVQSFREMFLKIKAPAEFWCNALMSCKEEEKYEYRNEIAAVGIQLIPPSFKLPNDNYYVTDNKCIQLPISAVKGLSNKNLDFDKCISINRLEDALSYTASIYDKGQMDTLIKIGFFDCFTEDRNDVLNTFGNKGQLAMDLFSETQKQFSKIDKYSLEKEFFGFWVTTHPMQIFDSGEKIIDVVRYKGNHIIGIVDTISLRRDKRGQPICFMKVGDDTYYTKVIIFNTIVNQMQLMPYSGDIIEIEGYMNEGSFIATKEPINVRAKQRN